MMAVQGETAPENESGGKRNQEEEGAKDDIGSDAVVVHEPAEKRTMQAK